MMSAVFWSYPVALLAFAVLPRRTAARYGVVLLAATAAVVTSRADLATGASYAITLAIIIVLMAWLTRRHAAVERTLAEQTITDPLTGAFNRRHLEACLAMAIERRNRTLEAASLVLLDIDHFKEINDAFGHSAGDDVLKRLVALIGGRMRSVDILFRTGGEEFALLLSGARYADAMLVAEELRLLVADATLTEIGGRISISAGVCELQKDQSAYRWIADADKALYRAKRTGRNRVAGRAPGQRFGSSLVDLPIS